MSEHEKNLHRMACLAVKIKSALQLHLIIVAHLKEMMLQNFINMGNSGNNMSKDKV